MVGMWIMERLRLVNEIPSQNNSLPIHEEVQAKPQVKVQVEVKPQSRSSSITSRAKKRVWWDNATK